jgi:hypothetical protein
MTVSHLLGVFHCLHRIMESSVAAVAAKPTTKTIFDGCDDSCGWTAALVAAIAYGSYGVPIKETMHCVDAHPLVLQSIKTTVMFALCWCVPYIVGVEVSWTSWGLVSGWLWVVGGTCGVYAIRAAGMAVAVGTWASTMIVVNFVWGILIFQEPVANFWATVGAFVCLGIGLVGMSVFSAPKEKGREKEKVEEQQMLLLGGGGVDDDDDEEEDDASRERTVTKTAGRRGTRERSTLRRDTTSTNIQELSDTVGSPSKDTSTRDGVVFLGGNSASGSEQQSSSAAAGQEAVVIVFGRTLSKRMAGIVAAVLNGLFAGSSLIPHHYAKEQGFGGANFFISYAVGAFIANTVLWVVFFVFKYCTRSGDFELSKLRFKQAYECMPSWHLKQLWLPGLLAGKTQILNMSIAS